MKLEDQELRKLQMKILDIVKYIDKLCKEENIEYFLMYGSCLGAVRHKGFIPWDDDFDIGMTYDNYLKFLKVCDTKLDKTKYFLQNNETENNFYLSFSKLRDINTTLIEETNKNIEMHKNVSIDIFPLSGYPTKKIQQNIFKLSRAFMLSANINVINNKILYRISRIIIKLLGKKRILKMTTQYCTKFDIKKSEYLCSFCDGDNIKLNLYKKEWLEKVKYVDFEDTKLPIPINYDKILKTTYKDYMKIPSKEEIAKKKHGIVYLNLEKGPNKTKKRILFIIWSFTYGGGAEKILANLVNNMDLDKYDIDILEYWHMSTKVEKVDNRINILKPIVDATRATKVEKLIKKILVEKKPSVIRKKYINKNYDYEISFNYMIPTFLLSKKCKTISWLHGDIYDLKNNIKNKKMQEESLKNVNKIVTISKNTFQSVLDIYPAFKDKTYIINNGFDFRKIEEKSKEQILKKNKFTLLFAGRLDDNKNPMFLIEVANILNKKGLKFELWMLGEGKLKDKLENKISEYNLANIVKLMGYIKNPYPYIYYSDIIVLSSISEGFPTIIAEGLSLGKPFVSTKVGGTEELSNKERCGFISNELNQYADYISKLIDNKELYKKMSIESKKYIKEFSIGTQVEKFEKLLDEIK